MMKKNILLLMLFINYCLSHSRLIEPVARTGGYCKLSDNCPVCGLRDMSHANPKDNIYKRGQVINVKWPRNNHAGGFVMLSIIPFDTSKKYENFMEIMSNVVQYSCMESNCKSHTDDPLGPDGEGYGEDGNICNVNLVIPEYLNDGEYILHWRWFGVGSWFGDMDKGHTDYYGCHDFAISGGNTSQRKSICPTFIGGDPHNNNGKQCKYFGSNRPGWCIKDGCPGKWYNGKPLMYKGCN